ncbi:hypothetical protein PLICRDRAFT_98902 [Plicaturopsis crispa FD-325 SS-3]|nr:hypothetical protein PLICRDRAFT_98902 [Plicaturopsis crispa FD-325 SS-3]
MDPLVYIVLAGLAATYVFYRRYTRISLSHVPGPEPESFLLGNLGQLLLGEAGQMEFKWQQEFGGVVRIKGPLGDNILVVSDPKALQYVYHTSGYGFKKLDIRRELSRITSGRGILWADGDVHKRHRKVMLPCFGTPEANAFLPIFRGCARKMAGQWKDIISGSADQSNVFNVCPWLTRATLDAIGEAAFDYNFGAMDNNENALARVYGNMLSDMFARPSPASIFFLGVAPFFPSRLASYVFDKLPSPRLERARETERVSTAVSRDLVASKRQAYAQGDIGRDIMSILVKSNIGENRRGALSEEEMLAQMRNIMIAGHETTSNTISWALLELAKHPDIQAKMRAEIWAAEKNANARGDSELTIKDFDGMHLTIAVMKEVLRFNPVVPNTVRQAAKDEVLPLSKPITTAKGEVLNQILVPKGTTVFASISAYNRDKDIWGEDAHTFRPERWLENSTKKGPSVGVYGNLASFAGGIRGCIGWRFAIVEMQALLVELVGHFEFSVTPETGKLRRESCLVMIPILEGEVDKGSQMPLRVTVAARDEADD